MDLIKQLEEQMRVFGVSTQRMSLTEEKIHEFDGGLREYFFHDFDYEAALQNSLRYCEEGTVYVVTDQFGLLYYTFLIPGVYTDGEGKEMMRIGPFLTEPLKQLVSRIMEKNKLTFLQEKELEDYLYGVPWMEEMASFESLILLQVHYIYGNKGAVEVNRVEEYYGQVIQPAAPQEKESSTLTMRELEERYRKEDEMLDAIRCGNMEEAFEAQKRLVFHHVNQREGYGTLRETKNMMIISNTLYRKAVQEAAVHPAHIDRLSRSFAKKIEECVFAKDMRDLGHEMIRKYCLLVRNHSLQSYSQIVRDAINYIECNMKEPVTLKELAENGNVSVSYLATRFKKEVGQSVVDYMNEKRVFASIRYLSTTDLTISEVAERVGINDENYFSRLFKKYQGRTPKQYRNLMRAKM